MTGEAARVFLKPCLNRIRRLHMTVAATILIYSLYNLRIGECDANTV